MKKVMIIISMLLFAMTLNAKTIWISYHFNEHTSVYRFQDNIIIKLKSKSYWKDVKIINNNNNAEIPYNSGDLLIKCKGNGFDSEIGYISYYYWTGLVVDECDELSYQDGASCLFTSENIIEFSQEMSNFIEEFIDNWY